MKNSLMDAFIYAYKHIILTTQIEDIEDANRVSGGRWPMPRTVEAHTLELHHMGVPLRFISQWASERVMSEALEDFFNGIRRRGITGDTLRLYQEVFDLNPEA